MNVIAIFLTPQDDGYLLFAGVFGVSEHAAGHHNYADHDGELGADAQARYSVRSEVRDLIEELEQLLFKFDGCILILLEWLRFRRDGVLLAIGGELGLPLLGGSIISIGAIVLHPSDTLHLAEAHGPAPDHLDLLRVALGTGQVLDIF